MPLKQRIRTPMFWWVLSGFAVVVLAVIWAWLPLVPRLVMDVDEGSYLLGFSSDGTLLATQQPVELIGAMHDLNAKGPIQLWSMATGKATGRLLEESTQGNRPCWSAHNGNILITAADAGAGHEADAVATLGLRSGSVRYLWKDQDVGGVLAFDAGCLFDFLPVTLAGKPALSEHFASQPPDHNLVVASRTTELNRRNLILWDLLIAAQ
jgi:hypothetical protein